MPAPLPSRFFRSALAALLLGCAALPVWADPQTIFVEEWSRDAVGASASQLAAWKKMVGFSDAFAEVIGGEAKGLRIAPTGGSASFISKDQFPAHGPVTVEIRFTRELPSGTWMRLSLVSAQESKNGVFVQLYRNEAELVRTQEGGDSVVFARKPFPSHLQPGEMLQLSLALDPKAGAATVLLNGEPLFVQEHESLLAAELASGNVRIGLRCQSDVQVVIHSIKLLTQDPL